MGQCCDGEREQSCFGQGGITFLAFVYLRKHDRALPYTSLWEFQASLSCGSSYISRNDKSKEGNKARK